MAARILALGVDYTTIFDQEQEDLPIHNKILNKAEEIMAKRRAEELEALIVGVGHQVVKQLF